jgi:hypothetical protein
MKRAVRFLIVGVTVAAIAVTAAFAAGSYSFRGTQAILAVPGDTVGYALTMTRILRYVNLGKATGVSGIKAKAVVTENSRDAGSALDSINVSFGTALSPDGTGFSALATSADSTNGLPFTSYSTFFNTADSVFNEYLVARVWIADSVNWQDGAKYNFTYIVSTR